MDLSLSPHLLAVVGGAIALAAIGAVCFPRHVKQATARSLGKEKVLPENAETYAVFGKWRSGFTTEAIEKRFAEVEAEIRRRSPSVKSELAELTRLRDGAFDIQRSLNEGGAVPGDGARVGAPPPPNWRSILGVPPNIYDLDDVKKAYRQRARDAHPDRGGSEDAFNIVTKAYEQACRELDFN